MKKTANKKSKKVNKLKASKKVDNPDTIEELLEKAENELNLFNYKKAQVHCQEALKKDPDNLKALEISSGLCIETGNLEGAKHCLGRAITLAPEGGFSKYFSMGQLLEGKDSLQCYLKGIELLNGEIRESSKCLGSSKVADEKDEANSEENEVHTSSSILHRKLSNAYCAIAELFMSDLCDEEIAETESLSNIQESISSDKTNPEAYLHYANYLLIKEELEEAKKHIKKSVSLWLPKYNEVEAGEASAGSFDPVDVCPLTQSARFQTSRILIEVGEHELAADVLEGILGEDDEDVYTWYLLGWNLYLQGEHHYPQAKHHFQRALQLNDSCPTPDQSIVDHTKELLKELEGVEVEDSEPEQEMEELEREIEEMDAS